MELKKRDALGIILTFLVIPIYFFTTLPDTKSYSFAALLFLLVFIQSRVIFNKENDNIFIFCGSLFALILVGITGWFNSPFLTYIYILALAFAFLFHYAILIAFILVFIGMFLLKGDVMNIYSASLTIVSFLILIPISYFLKRRYLYLSQAEKKILILKESNSKYKNLVDDILSNKITDFSTRLREPINDIKQIANVIMTEKSSDANLIKYHKNIVDLAVKSIQQIKKFEEKVTGIKLVETPSRSKSA